MSFDLLVVPGDRMNEPKKGNAIALGSLPGRVTCLEAPKRNGV
jgi:hypothetical protein